MALHGKGQGSEQWEAERALLQDEIEQLKGRERQAIVRFQQAMEEVCAFACELFM